jgi:signal transduction histidine kinase/ligand-binding sensor domain-containing protein
MVRLQGVGVVRLKNGRFESIETGSAPAASRVTAMRKDGNGGVLLTDLMTGTIRFRNEKVEELAPAGPLAPAISLAVTPGGKIWIGTLNSGLFSLSHGQTTSIQSGLPYKKINCLLAVSDDELWVGTDNGAFRWNGARFTKVALPKSVGDTQVLTMMRDRDANIWLGTVRGLLRINGGGISVSEEREFLGIGSINALFEDREGNVWVGGARGLERIRDSAFVTYSTATGLPSEHIGPVFADSQNRTWFAPLEGGLYMLTKGEVQPIKVAGLDKDVIYSISGLNDGTMWIGRQHGGLTRLRYDNGVANFQTYSESNGLAQNSVYSVYRNHDGTVWAGTLSGGVSKLKDGRFVTYTTANGLASNTVSSILETRDGKTWFATSNGLSSLTKDRWRTYTLRDGLPSDNVNCLYQDSSGVLWIGTSAGLVFLNSGQIQVPREAHQSLRAEIFGVAEDKNEWLWLATSNHVLRVQSLKLSSRGLEGSDVREYGLADGLRSIEGVKRSQSVVIDRSGKIWFSMSRGLSVVDPSHIPDSSEPAMAHIEAISADGKMSDLGGQVRIPAAPKRITVSYTGLSLAVPERVRFRYILDTFDRGWSEPVAAHEAVYTNLSPGFYRFRVIASNSDGLWNGPEAMFPFEVEPLWWQRWWFRLCGLLFSGFVILALYRMRLQQQARQLNLRFEERLSERTRIAQDLHDTLLQGVLSASMQLHVANDQLSTASPAKPIVSRVLDLMGHVIDDGRNTLRGLRSSGDAGNLEQAFSQIPQELSVPPAIDFRVLVEGQVRPLHPVIRDEVYRIGREALVNAVRHSRATGIEVELEYANHQLRVLVRDNGCGIDPQVLRSGRDGHWGLSGMRERAEGVGARLKLWSRLAGGTEVELSVPGHVAYRQHSSARGLWWLLRLHRPKVEHDLQNRGSEREK